MNNVRLLIEDFANQLAALVESQALDQARAVVERALGVRRPGRPPKTAPLALTAEPLQRTGKKARKKMPKQFCPVPGCKNSAAPVFGMVCADHKNVAKSKIKKYRAARKAKKLGLKAPKAAKPRAPKAAPPKPAKRRAKKVARPKAAHPKAARPTPPVAAPKPPVADAA